MRVPSPRAPARGVARNNLWALHRAGTLERKVQSYSVLTSAQSCQKSLGKEAFAGEVEVKQREKDEKCWKAHAHVRPTTPLPLAFFTPNHHNQTFISTITPQRAPTRGVAVRKIFWALHKAWTQQVKIQRCYILTIARPCQKKFGKKNLHWRMGGQ